MICDAYDFSITIFIGYVLGVITMISVQDISDYLRSRRGE